MILNDVFAWFKPHLPIGERAPIFQRNTIFLFPAFLFGFTPSNSIAIMFTSVIVSQVCAICCASSISIGRCQGRVTSWIVSTRNEQTQRNTWKRTRTGTWIGTRSGTRSSNWDSRTFSWCSSLAFVLT
jgi:hypothetical protein